MTGHANHHANGQDKKPRCYLVTVGTSLLSKCKGSPTYKTHPGWSADSIEKLEDEAIKPYTHEKCLTSDNPRFKNYERAYTDVAKWVKEHVTQFDELLKDCSAELSSLYRGAPPEEILPGGQDLDKVVLVHTNTPAGVLCARLLKETLTQSPALKAEGCSFQQDCVTEKPCELLGSAGDPGFAKLGIPQFVGLLRDVILEHSKDCRVFLIPTGGYKSLIPYATITGMLLRREIEEIRYIYEDSNERLRLPVVPLGVDFYEWHLNAFLVSLTLAGSEEAFRELNQRSPEIAEMLNGDGPPYTFNEFGDFLWQEYRRVVWTSSSLTQRDPPVFIQMARIPSLAQRTIRFMQEWENLWEGMRLPQIVSHTHAHCHNLVCLAEQLLGPVMKSDIRFMEPVELYLLTAAIWLHDIGHNEHYLEELEGGPQFLSLEGVRKEHAKLAYQRIARKAAELGFLPDFEHSDEAQLIATICLVHRGPESIERHIDQLRRFEGLRLGIGGREYEVKQPVLVACLLSILDTCDIGVARAGNAKFRNARTRATIEEIEATAEHLRSLPDQEEEYRRLLEDDLKFLKASPDHFKNHAAIARVSLQVDSLDTDKKAATVVIHPNKTARDSDPGFDPVEHVDRCWHLRRDIEGFNRVIQNYCGGRLILRLSQGQELDEDEVFGH